MGRAFDNALLNLGLKKQYEDGVSQLGFNLEDLIDQERDAGLGNGGLGRLAACYLDSSSSMELPLWGYGLRYQYGIFQQLIGPDGRCVLFSHVFVYTEKLKKHHPLFQSIRSTRSLVAK